MQPVELLTEEAWPYDLPVDKIKEPPPPTQSKHILSKYHKDSPLQSVFSVFYAKVDGEYKGIKNTWLKKELTLLQVYELIKSEAFKAETQTLQSIEDPLQAKEFKNTHFNYACLSGTFSRRGDKYLINHSSLICIDLDKLGDELYWIRETVNRDPLTIMSFVSPSGNGLKIIYRIQPGRYSQETYYQYLSYYLSDLLYLPKQSIDEACKDVSRACFLPYDPFAYLNLNLL